MSTSPVMSITDELVAELEALASKSEIRDEQCMSGVTFGDIRALLAERAELKRDAERYRWLLDSTDSMHWENMLHFSDFESKEEIGRFIDAAMQSEAKQ